MMDCCKKRGIAPAQIRGWEEAKRAYHATEEGLCKK